MNSIVCLLLAIAVPASAQTKPLRLLSWNIHHGVGEDGKLDLPRIANVISKAAPDIVALQEVDNQCSRSGKIDQTAELARLTGMTGIFGKAMDFQGGAYGQAILCRFPLKSHKVHMLPGTGEPRMAFEAKVSNASFNLQFLSIHLGLDAAERLVQAETVAKLIGEGSSPTILCGDFNDIPGSAPLAAISRVCQAIPKRNPRLTCPAGKPDSEIDHVFTKGISPARPLTVLPETVASDHRPLLAVFVELQSCSP